MENCEHAELILDDLRIQKIAWMRAGDLPTGYFNDYAIPFFVRKVFDNNEVPIILRGSRARMAGKYKNKNGIVIEFINKAVRMMKITIFYDDQKNARSYSAETSSEKKRVEKYRLFVEAVKSKMAKSYPSVRFDEYYFYNNLRFHDVVLGNKLNVKNEEERKRIKIIVSIAEKTITNIEKLQKILNSA
jgi:hypothetical protein